MCSCCMRNEAERWYRFWGLMPCPQVSIIHACVLMVARSAGVLS
jgi:hypothetical protein